MRSGNLRIANDKVCRRDAPDRQAGHANEVTSTDLDPRDHFETVETVVYAHVWRARYGDDLCSIVFQTLSILQVRAPPQAPLLYRAAHVNVKPFNRPCLRSDVSSPGSAPVLWRFDRKACALQSPLGRLVSSRIRFPRLRS